LSEIIKRSSLLKYFPKRTVDDLYLYISYHQWGSRQTRRYGIGIDRLIPRQMEAFREQMASQGEKQYPEMKREITAFVLMTVEGKHEYRVIDRLFATQEVQEVHSVHGNIDLLVKIVLSRDLLASDAELISQFVHENIRQLPGVKSTQTLIPGFSKIKGERE
jgi:DNA-binding Lrp family transcriptional regulator